MKKLFFIILIGAMLSGCAAKMNRTQETATAELEAAMTVPDDGEHDKTNASETLFYPMPPYEPRLQFLGTIDSESDEQDRNTSLKRRNFLRIRRPFDIAAVKGRLYISDREFRKVLIVDLQTQELDIIAGPYESAGIWVTDEDIKYIADFSNQQVVVFDRNNKITKVYAAPDLFDKPTDVAVYGNKVYVCDLNRHQIIVLDRDSGEAIEEIGGIGTDEGTFYKPTHVILDKEGNIYVNDFFNLRVQKFDGKGNFLQAFGKPGDTLGAFARPKGIGVDMDGHLYAVDAAFENVQIFDDSTTDLLLFFGSFGLEPGTMYLPNALSVDYKNVEYFKKFAHENFDVQYLVYVANTWGPVRLNVYGFGTWTGPPFAKMNTTIEDTSETVNE